VRRTAVPKIHYAQCWEDPRALTRALEVTPEDDVISIASGGDNTFALLLDNPRSVTAVDRNPAQVFLVELKMRAIQELSYDEFIRFVGARSCRNRESLYASIRPSLSHEAREYWDERPQALRKGIIHCGKFERYFAIFRRFVLPLIHGPGTVQRLLTVASSREQERFFDGVWNNRRWRWLFRIFFGKFLLGRLGRDPSFFRYVNVENIAENLLQRTRRGLRDIPVHDNFFVEQIFTGKYGKLEAAPPYLCPSNFEILKERLGRLRLVCASLQELLKALQPRTISKLNLSDIFEYISNEQVELTLQEILRVCRDDARLAFWTLFIPRTVPSALTRWIKPCSSVAGRLLSTDRTFFYGSFCLWRLSPANGTVKPKTQMVPMEQRSSISISEKGD
jgi:S-adenosylmethionine-diacylglycerol 3-amino-3-carboxypropyl transferase